MKPVKVIDVVGISDKDYLKWIQDLCNRYRQSQIKASLQINKGMLSFYWELGKDIEERKYDNKYGSRFYENLSRDLSNVLNNKKGLAPTSLRYTKYFYCLYAPLFENCRQVADEFDLLFSIPWSHHQKIIDKVKGDARYALSRINSPIGISEFELSKRQIPEELKDSLPTIEEIERCMNV